MTKHTLAMGVAYGGKQSPDFWGPMTAMAANFHKIDVDYIGVYYAGSMMVDGNRNNIVTGFLKGEAEWLLWIDTDMSYKLGAIRRLLDMRKTLCSGVYVGKQPPHTNIAYRRTPNSRYRPVSEFEDYYKGEIIPIDMAGMGFLLTHRTVYEDMKKEFTILMDADAQYHPIQNSKIKGEVSATAKNPYDGEIHKGQYRVRMRPLDHPLVFWPWFQMRHGKTEDVPFFENAAKAGHKAWLDTSLQAKHFGDATYTPQDRTGYAENTEVERHPRNYEVKYDFSPPD